MRQKRLQSRTGCDRMEMEIGDLVYHNIADTYGIILEVSMTGADTRIEWSDGDISYNFYDNVLIWKKLADEKLEEKLCVPRFK